MGSRIDDVLVSFPFLPGLYEKDVLDALQFENILGPAIWQSVTPYSEYNHPHTAAAAYAGHGLGLCNNYTDIGACRKQEEEMQEEKVYTITYTNNSMHATLSRISALRPEYEAYDPTRAAMSFSLGYSSLGARKEEHYYWAKICVFLAQLPRSFQHDGPITKVVLVGDGILREDPLTLAAVVEDVLTDYQTHPAEVFADDPVFASALGARRMAVRWQSMHVGEAGGAETPHLGLRSCVGR